MPRNGSGSYSLPAGNPVVPSTVISSTWANTTLSDLGTALTQSIANDGQTTPVANLPMATFRHTNVGNAVARNDYAAAGQVQDSSLQWLTSVAGVDTITASIAPGPTAYVAGQTFRFVAAGANTTASVTLNINGLGAKAITKLGIGSLQSGTVVQVVYDGTQFQPVSAPSGALINVQRISATGTYTPTAGTSSVVVHIVGGGGAGGGAPATGAGQVSVGGGGGGGAWSVSRLTSGFSGVTVTIGAGGTGVSGANGNSGSASSFGALIVVGGGGGGNAGGAATVSSAAAGGGGSVTTAGNVLFTAGTPGSPGFTQAAHGMFGGIGGASPYGVPSAAATGNSNGIGANTGHGAGGGGACSNSGSQPAFTGGDGSAGLCIIYEYA